MARTFVSYPEGSAQSVLQDALTKRYPEAAERFFNDVATKLKIQPESASSTFYGFLGARRSLPAAHRVEYQRLLGVSDDVLDQIAAEFKSKKTVEGRAQLANLEAQVEALQERVADLEELQRRQLRGGPSSDQGFRQENEA